MDTEEENYLFQKKSQHIYIYNSVFVTEFNMNKYIFDSGENYMKIITPKKNKAEADKEIELQDKETQLQVLDKMLLLEANENIITRISKFVKINFILMNGEISKNIEKKKYDNFFDFVVVGFNNNQKIFSHLKSKIKDNENGKSKLWMEIPQ